MDKLPTLIMFQSLLALKENNHHYCGFFSDVVLPGIINDLVVINNLTYVFSNKFEFEIAYDGIDSIITLKKQFYIKDATKLSRGDLIYNTDQQVIGLVTHIYMDHDGQHYVLVQDGFKYLNIHITDSQVEIINKTRLIAYAGQQFDTKQQLIQYINAKNKTASGKIHHVIYHQNYKNVQYITHLNGVNISNMQLRYNIARAQY